MAVIKFATITPSGSGPSTALTMNFEDTPDGLTINTDFIRPVFSRRTADGTLVNQSVVYNKKEVTVEGGTFQIDIMYFMRDLYTSGATSVFEVFDITDPDFTSSSEYTITAMLTEYAETKDMMDNKRTFSATFREV